MADLFEIPYNSCKSKLSSKFELNRKHCLGTIHSYIHMHMHTDVEGTPWSLRTPAINKAESFYYNTNLESQINFVERFHIFTVLFPATVFAEHLHTNLCLPNKNRSQYPLLPIQAIDSIERKSNIKFL